MWCVIRGISSQLLRWDLCLLEKLPFRRGTSAVLIANTHVRCVQLPVYVPSEEEKKDPTLYAANVRAMMLRVGGFKPSAASLQDSRAYIALLQACPCP